MTPRSVLSQFWTTIRFFHDVLSPSRFQPERLFPQCLVEEGRSGSGLAHDQLSFCPVFRAPA